MIEIKLSSGQVTHFNLGVCMQYSSTVNTTEACLQDGHVDRCFELMPADIVRNGDVGDGPL